MEAGKGAAASAMEAAANVAASAKSGLEKTKAVVVEKMGKLTTSDPIEKDMSTVKKEEKIMRAELSKREAYTQNAAASVGPTESYTAIGKSDLVGHGAPHDPTKPHHGLAGVDDGLATEDVVGSYYVVGTAEGEVDPPDSNTGTGGTRAGGTTGTTKDEVGSQYVVDPPDSNNGTGKIPVGGSTGTTKGVLVGSQYPVGENTGSGRTPVCDDEGSGQYVVDPPDSNNGSRVVGSQYPVGENMGSGRTPVRDDEGSGQYVVDPPDSDNGTGVVGSQYPVGENTGSGRTPVRDDEGSGQYVMDPADSDNGTGVVGSQYPVGENTGSGRTPVRDDEGSGHTTIGGMYP